MLQVAAAAENSALEDLRQIYRILRWDEIFMRMI